MISNRNKLMNEKLKIYFILKSRHKRQPAIATIRTRTRAAKRVTNGTNDAFRSSTVPSEANRGGTARRQRATAQRARRVRLPRLSQYGAIESTHGRVEPPGKRRKWRRRPDHFSSRAHHRGAAPQAEESHRSAKESAWGSRDLRLSGFHVISQLQFYTSNSNSYY